MRTEPVNNYNMTDLFAAIGLAIALEGILYALFPDAMKKYMKQILELPALTIRRVGVVAAIFGVIVVWLVRGSTL